jgi:hypothetical protein
MLSSFRNSAIPQQAMKMAKKATQNATRGRVFTGIAQNARNAKMPQAQRKRANPRLIMMLVPLASLSNCLFAV